MKGWGEIVSELMIVKKNKQLQETVHSTVLLGCFYFLNMLQNSNLSRVKLLLVGCVYCCSCLVCIVVIILCVFVVLCVHCCFFTLDAGLLARSQYTEGPATGHLDTGFSWFPCVYKQMLRRFPTFPSCHYMLLM